MAKRFYDTNKYRLPFIRGLQGAYKLLWDYINHDCDHAGIWIVDFEVAQLYLGSDIKINIDDSIKHFGEKVIVFDNGSKWFIPSFIEIQYGELNEKNRVHQSAIILLKKFNLIDENFKIIKPLISPLQGVKEKDKDKDKDKEEEKDKETNQEEFDFAEVLDQFPFDEFWDIYDKKTGRPECEVLFSKLSEKDKELIWAHVPKYVANTPDKTYRLNPQTYLNSKKRHWEDEIIIKSNSQNGTTKQNTGSALADAHARNAEYFANLASD